MRLGVVAVALACGGCQVVFDLGARPVSDASPDAFDPAGCPDSYVAEVASSGSRYRINRELMNAAAAEVVCELDQEGHTHLVALDSFDELVAVHQWLANEPDTLFVWVGGVQQANQPMPGTGWLNITGGPLLDGYWNVNEPNDNRAPEDGMEQHVMIHSEEQAGLIDNIGMMQFPSVCECDGKPVDPVAAQLIRDLGPPPGT